MSPPAPAPDGPQEACFFNSSSSFSFHNCSSAFCMAVPSMGGTLQDQVSCSATNLDMYEPPSIYEYSHYTELWEPITCLLWNVTYDHRVNLEDSYNFCIVPLKGYDAFLFVSLALLAAAVLFGKLSAVWVLIAGGVLGVVNYNANLMEVSNSISLWLGIQPPDLFFYAFLPPLLVDSAIRIDFFMFRKLWVHIVMMAFVMVVLSALILTPLILFVLGFINRSWSWVHGALFAAMIASTDALAAAAILKQGGGPEKLVVLMEGEALLNDASAITLFEVFMHILEEHQDPSTPWPSVWSVLPTILEDIARLAGVGLAIGLAMSMATYYLLRWLRWRGAKPYIETTIVLAVAYLSFYVTNAPAKGSGVIAVVVFGLYGNATSKWGMLSSTEESGVFDAVWDTISFGANGLVFFWSGVASVNYFERSASTLGYSAWSYGAIPLVYLFMVCIRGSCLTLFNPLFKALGEVLSWREILFTTWSGLRGAVSLIMIADFVVESNMQTGTELDVVNADIALWTASFVLLTLVFNAPTISTVLKLLKLNKIPLEKQKMRSKAKRALLRFTEAAISNLHDDDDDEFLRGANWEAVAQYVDMTNELSRFDPPPDGTEPPPDPAGRLLQRCLAWWSSCWRPRPLDGGGATAVAAPATAAAGHGAAAAGIGAGAGFAAAMGWVAGKGRQLVGRGPKHGGGGGGVSGGENGGGNGAGAAELGGAGLNGAAYAESRAGEGDSSSGSGRAALLPSGRPSLDRTSARHSVHSAAYDSDVESSSMSSAGTDDTFTVRSPAPGPRTSTAAAAAAATAAALPPSTLPAPSAALAATRRSFNVREQRPASRRAMLARRGSAPAAGAGSWELGGREGAAGGAAVDDFLEEVLEECPFLSPLAPAAAAATQEAAKPASREEEMEMGVLQPLVTAASTAGAAITAGFVSLGGIHHHQQQQQQGQQLEQQGQQQGVGQGQLPPHPSSPRSPRGAAALASGSVLESITEGQQLDLSVEQGRQQWQQGLAPASPSARGLGAQGEVDYYSSMPAAVGRQLQQQLMQQLRRSTLTEGPAGTAAIAGTAGTAGTGASAVPGAAAVAAAQGELAAVGAQQQQQQQQREQEEERSAPVSPVSGSVPASGSAVDYYSSMPAAVGRQLQQQLMLQLAREQQAQHAEQELTQQAQQAAPELPPPPPSVASESVGQGEGEEEGGLYYSSLPAAVGQRMAQQLRQAQAAAAAGAAGAAGGAGGAGSSSTAGGSPSARSASLAHAPSDQELQYYSSVPAASRQQLAAALQAQLAAARAVGGAPGSPPARLPPRGGSPLGPRSRPHSRTPSEMDLQQQQLYYSSVPATAGRALQAQLAAQLAAQRAAAAATPAVTPPAALPLGPEPQLSSQPGSQPGTQQEAQQAQQAQQQLLGQEQASPGRESESGAECSAGPTPRPPLSGELRQASLPKGGGSASDLDAQYYSSLPLQAGRAMQAQLAQLRQAAAAGAAAEAATVEAAGEQDEVKGSEDESSAVESGRSSPLAGARAARGAAAAAGAGAGAFAAGAESEEGPSESDRDLPVEYSSSLPAGARHSLQAALQAKLRKQQQQAAASGSGSKAGAAAATGAAAAGKKARGSPLSRAGSGSTATATVASTAAPSPLTPAPASPPTVLPAAPAPAAAVPAAPAAPKAAKASPGKAAPAHDHFSTMPAAMGQRMRAQLQTELAAERQRQAAAAAAATGAAAGASGSGVAGAASLAAARGAVPESARVLSTLRSLPPSGARRLHPWQHAKAQKASSLPPPLPRPPGAAAAAGPADHYATLSGVTGASLASELRRQLSGQRGEGGAPLQRDLLGRKLTPPQLAASSPHAAWTAAVAPFAGRPGLAPSGVGGARLPADKHPLSRHKSAEQTFGGSIMGASTPMSDALRGMSRSQLGSGGFAAGGGGEGGSSSNARRMRHHSRSLSAHSSHSQQEGEGGSVVAAAAAPKAPAFRHLVADPGARHSDRTWQHAKPLKRLPSAASSTPRAAAGAASLLAMTYATTADAVPAGPPALGHVSPHMLNRADTGDGSLHGARSFGSGLGGAPSGTGREETEPTYTSGPGKSGGLDASHESGQGGPAMMVPPQALAEMRSRLVSGLKRYFHAKRMEGLLSVTGMRILEWACEAAIEHSDQPLGLWARLEQEVKGDLWTRFTARMLQWLVRGYMRMPRWAQWLLGWPTHTIGDLLRGVLGRKLLVACEVSVEYYLALLHSPQIQWMKSTDEAWPLQAEVDAEVGAAYKFIIDREIEAPDRFQAIQSYRAAMAVIRQQLTFVQELFDTGMVDSGESEYMMDPLDKKMRHLEIVGPVWRPPKPRVVLRSLPFMAALPEPLFQMVYSEGDVKFWKSGLVVWSASDLVERSNMEQGPGAFIVLSGVVKRLYIRPDGTKKEYYQGTGGSVGVLLATTGSRLPGTELALAEGNTLGKGPLLFHLPQALCRKLARMAEAGDTGAAHFVAQQKRLSALYVVECLEGSLVALVEAHLTHLAATKAERVLHRRQQGAAGRLPPLPPPAVQPPPAPALAAAGAWRRRGASSGEEGGPGTGTTGIGGGGGGGAVGLASGLTTARGATLSGGEEGGAGGLGAGGGAGIGGGVGVGGVPNSIATRGQQLSNLMQMIAQLEFEELEGARSSALEGGASSGALAREPSRRWEPVEEEEEEEGEEGDSEEEEGEGEGGKGAPLMPDTSRLLSSREKGIQEEEEEEEGMSLRQRYSFQQRQRQAQRRGSGRSGGSGKGAGGLVSWEGGAGAGAPGQKGDGDGEGKGKGAGAAGPAAAAAGAAAAVQRSAQSEQQAKAERYIHAKSRSAVRRAPMYAAELMEELRRGVALAEVLELPPGASWRQVSHGVLLRGQLRELAPDWGMDELMAGHYRRHPHHNRCPRGPLILPWLWAGSLRCSSGSRSLAPPYTRWAAGAEGATLVVWLPESGELPRVEEAPQSLAGRPTQDTFTSSSQEAVGGAAACPCPSTSQDGGPPACVQGQEQQVQVQQQGQGMGEGVPDPAQAQAQMMQGAAVGQQQGGLGTGSSGGAAGTTAAGGGAGGGGLVSGVVGDVSALLRSPLKHIRTARSKPRPDEDDY